MESWTRFIVLLLVISLCGAEEEKKNLSGTKGGNITLPDPLLERAYLLYGGKDIARVDNGKLYIIKESYTNRLQWNKSSGLFTLTDLQRRDSGIYIIDSIEGKIFAKSFNVTVYDPVAPPAVQTLNVSSDSCYLLCAVDKAAEITLWWYKDQEVVDQSRSAGPLPLTVTKQDFNSSYRCVAGNPAENKTLLVDLQKVCGENFTAGENNTESRHRWIITGVSTGCAVLTVTVAAFLIWLTCFSTSERKDSLDSTTEVEYAGVNICADTQSGRTFPGFTRIC